MKLADASLCLDCDEIVSSKDKACPSCTNEVLVPFSKWIDPLPIRKEINLVRAVAEYERISGV